MSTTALSPELEREHWLEQRKLGIGGSDCASVFSEGYGCVRALAYDKSDEPTNFQRTERELRILRRGTAMEELVADEYSVIAKRKIRRMATRISKDYPWMRVNIDRQILGDSRGPGALEVKTASPWVFRQMQEKDETTGEAKGLPIQYFLQLQHALAVTGYKWGAFAVMNATSWEMLIFEEARHEEWIATIVEREKAFWEMLQAGTLPEPLEKANDRRCASCMWRKTCRGQVVIVPEDEREFAVEESLAELAIDYAEACDKKEAFEDAAKNIRTQMEAVIADRPGVLIPSVGVRIRWKLQNGRTSWDSKALQSLVDGLKRLGADPMAEKVLECKKTSAPTRPFYFERAGEDF